MVPPQNGTYGIPVVAAPPHGSHNMRAYHHPDTPGGPDAHSGQNPFAFFKMPLGAQIQHPSAYLAHPNEKHAPRYTTEPQSGSLSSQETLGPSSSSRPGTNGSSKHQISPHRDQQVSGREKRTVPPAVSGLSLRIGGVHSNMAADAPRSAPVDGPNQKRRISHDEVIMALRRKVMGKSGSQAQPQPQQQLQQQQQHKHMPPLRPIPPATKTPSGASRRFADEQATIRRSSLAKSTHIDSPDCVQDDVPMSSSSSSSSSSTTSEDFPLAGEEAYEEEEEEEAEVSALRSLASTAATEESRRGSKKPGSTAAAAMAKRKKHDNPHRASSIAHIMDG
ncbi:hypothetical protein LPJ74_005739 [Coemansia sp. RSA 1843]|nr:hypothetical protein LPJ74_005739 [Coemansia sp. RSA 1843]